MKKDKGHFYCPHVSRYLDPCQHEDGISSLSSGHFGAFNALGPDSYALLRTVRFISIWLKPCKFAEGREKGSEHIFLKSHPHYKASRSWPLLNVPPWFLSSHLLCSLIKPHWAPGHYLSVPCSPSYLCVFACIIVLVIIIAVLFVNNLLNLRQPVKSYMCIISSTWALTVAPGVKGVRCEHIPETNFCGANSVLAFTSQVTQAQPLSAWILCINQGS